MVKRRPMRFCGDLVGIPLFLCLGIQGSPCCHSPTMDGQMLQLSWRARIGRLDPTPGKTPSIPMVKGNFTCGTVGIREQYGGSIQRHIVHLYFWAGQ